MTEMTLPPPPPPIVYGTARWRQQGGVLFSLFLACVCLGPPRGCAVWRMDFRRGWHSAAPDDSAASFLENILQLGNILPMRKNSFNIFCRIISLTFASLSNRAKRSLSILTSSSGSHVVDSAEIIAEEASIGSAYE